MSDTRRDVGYGELEDDILFPLTSNNKSYEVQAHRSCTVRHTRCHRPQPIREPNPLAEVGTRALSSTLWADLAGARSQRGFSAFGWISDGQREQPLRLVPFVAL